MVERRLAVLVFVFGLIVPSLSLAALLPAAVAEARFEERLGLKIPLDVGVTDEHGKAARLGDIIAGKPAILLFADFTCDQSCGTAVVALAAVLREMGLAPGKDYVPLVIGLDSTDTPSAANTMKRERLTDDDTSRAMRFLIGSPEGIKSLLAAAGVQVAYDALRDQFAHPLGVVVTTGDGTISRYVPGPAPNPSDLRLAVVEAGKGKVGAAGDLVRLVCYSFNSIARAGSYLPYVPQDLMAGGLGGATLLGGIVMVFRRARRRPHTPLAATR